jgi:hypothetical protein
MLEPITPLTEATAAREQAEAALRLSEEKFAMAFRCSPDALIISSIPDSRIREVNELCRAAGQPARYASEAAEHLALARAASLPPDAKATPLPKL